MRVGSLKSPNHAHSREPNTFQIDFNWRSVRWTNTTFYLGQNSMLSTLAIPKLLFGVASKYMFNLIRSNWKRDPRQCLVHDTNIDDHLPVTKGDHVVSKLIIMKSGDLLMAVGVLTNIGLPRYNIGETWESYLSPAIDIVNLSKHGFNGTISQAAALNYRTAKPVHGYDDVALYASGVRSTFALVMSWRRVSILRTTDRTKDLEMPL